MRQENMTHDDKNQSKLTKEKTDDEGHETIM